MLKQKKIDSSCGEIDIIVRGSRKGKSKDNVGQNRDVVGQNRDVVGQNRDVIGQNQRYYQTDKRQRSG